MMSLTKPEILFCHGSWTFNLPYEKFQDYLTTEGYTIHTPKLQAYRLLNHPDPAGEDVKLMTELAVDLIGNDKEIIAMAHSNGGVILSEALAGLGVETRKAQGLKGGVKCMIYIASFFLDIGLSIEDLVPIDTVPMEYKVCITESLSSPLLV
jgi:hypothetical protein